MKTATLKKIFNLIFSCGLSFLIINSILFSGSSNNHSHEQYGLCNTGCQDENHFLKAYQCDRIQNNNEKFIFYNQIIIYSKFELQFLEVFYDKYIESTKSFSLYCRPPPKFFC
tara:strand:+ start:202 stop:540 length:339 start_codon:yes stop_codon:yes gene_type:complete